MKARKKFLLTSALPYANGPLHFGHIAGAYLPGDCFARFQRFVGNEVVYVCGSDEYGIAITLSAELAHKTPKEHVDYFHKMNCELFQKLNFSFDHFSRTTSALHPQTVREFFENLYANGYIEERVEDHLFSEKENRFLADRYVVGTCPKCGYEKARGDECPTCGASFEAIDLKNPRSKITGSELILKPSKHWYLRFDKFKERLKKWIAQKNWKPNVLKFSESYIKDLRARAITRDSSWGIKIPIKGAVGKVFYVWFDAPIGYITATKEWAQKMGDPNLWKSYWMDPNVELIHFIGKDNIPFHTVFFPAMLMGQNESYILPADVPANEFLMLEGKQFSKSEGWYIDLEDFFQKYTTDQIRYYLAANAPENSDADFCWKDFQKRCNSELLGKLGNFIHRTVTFAHSHCKAMVPQIVHPKKDDRQFLDDIEKITDNAYHAFSSFRLRKACQILMDLAQCGNTYFDHREPWVLAKKENKNTEMKTVISCCLQCIKNIAILCYPIIPETANKIWHLLGFRVSIEEENWENIVQSLLPSEQVLKSPKILFEKIEDEQIEKEIVKLMEKKASSDVSEHSEIKRIVNFQDFEKLDLRVAKILSAEPIAKSKKLLKIKVDLGFEERIIVSGIAKYFQPEELVGKKVVVVANLKPAKLMGIESQGMILTASLENELELLELQKLTPGSTVF